MLSLWLSIVPELRKVDILGDPKILFIGDFLQSFSLETASEVNLFGSCEEVLSLYDQKGDSVLLSRRFCTDNVSCDNLVKIYPFLSFVCPSARETRDGISPTSGLTRLKGKMHTEQGRACKLRDTFDMIALQRCDHNLLAN